MVHHSHHHSPVSLLHMAVQQDWRQCSAGTCYSHLALIYKDLPHILLLLLLGLNFLVKRMSLLSGM